MENYQKDPQAAKAALAQLDTVLIGEPQVTEHIPNGPQTRKINPSDYTFQVHSFKRGNSSNFYLQWQIVSKKTELLSGPLDFVSIEWDTHVASYYSSNGDSNMSTVQGKNTGIVLFNVEDNKLKNGKSTYGTVQVTPIKKATLNFGSKYVHTYTSFIFGGSASYSFSPSASLDAAGIPSLGLSYTYGFKVNVSSNTSQWQL